MWNEASSSVPFPGNEDGLALGGSLRARCDVVKLCSRASRLVFSSLVFPLSSPVKTVSCQPFFFLIPEATFKCRLLSKGVLAEVGEKLMDSGDIY